MFGWKCLRLGLVYSLAITTIAASGCGSLEEPEHGRVAGAGGEFQTMRQPSMQVCGADRYMGTQGVDVSYYQPNFDWKDKAGKGIEFGFARVSDGTTVIDDKFDRHWKGMKNNGIIRGAYQYFRPGQSAKKQANIMVNKVGQLGSGELPCVIDVEADGGQSPSTIASKIKTWMQIVEKGTGKKPIIYTSPGFWEGNVKDTSFGDHPLWVAHWGTSCPSVPNGWNDWTFWQYCDGKTQHCKNGEGFDRNVFNGSSKELEKFAGGSAGGADWGASYVDQSFPLSSMGMTMKTGETVAGYIELKNTGEKSWNSKTHLGTTEPRDRNSKFAGQTWVDSDRPAKVSGEVKPGESYKFQFSLHAPDQTGTYTENFGVVQEGVTWFSDMGQGGPPDDQIEIKITVVEEMSQTPDTGMQSDVGTDPGGDTGMSGNPSNPDTGNGAGPDAGGGANQPLGPLVARSNGVQRGCSNSAPASPLSPPLALLSFLALGALRWVSNWMFRRC